MAEAAIDGRTTGEDRAGGAATFRRRLLVNPASVAAALTRAHASAKTPEERRRLERLQERLGRLIDTGHVPARQGPPGVAASQGSAAPRNAGPGEDPPGGEELRAWSEMVGQRAIARQQGRTDDAARIGEDMLHHAPKLDEAARKAAEHQVAAGRRLAADDRERIPPLDGSIPSSLRKRLAETPVTAVVAAVVVTSELLREGKAVADLQALRAGLDGARRWLHDNGIPLGEQARDNRKAVGVAGEVKVRRPKDNGQSL